MPTLTDVFNEFRGHVHELREQGQLRQSTTDLQDDIVQETYLDFLRLQETNPDRAEQVAGNRAYIRTMLRNKQCDLHKTRESRQGKRQECVFWDAWQAPPDPPSNVEIKFMLERMNQQAELIAKTNAKVRSKIRRSKGIRIASRGMQPLVCLMANELFNGKAISVRWFVRTFCEPKKRRQCDILSQMKKPQLEKYGPGVNEFDAEFWLPALIEVAKAMGLTVAEAVALIDDQR